MGVIVAHLIVPSVWVGGLPLLLLKKVVKDDRAFEFINERGYLRKESLVVKLPEVEGYDLGYMAIQYYAGSGHNYFRVGRIVGGHDQKNVPEGELMRGTNSAVLLDEIMRRGREILDRDGMLDVEEGDEE